MENILYTKLANFYNIIADDRDFLQECFEIIETYKRLNNQLPKSVLELFAGPAYHAQIFEEKHQIEAYAIDNSEEMKDLACNKRNITKGRYILGSLPDILMAPVIPKKLDLILIMRYSLGLISYKSVATLLKFLENHLSLGGLIIIELHDLDSFINQFSNLDIKTRKKYFPENQQTIICTWPSGPLKCDKKSWKVTMPITISAVNEKGNEENFTTFSHEEIYTTSDIERMISDSNLSIINDSLKFGQSISNNIIIQKVGL